MASGRGLPIFLLFLNLFLPMVKRPAEHPPGEASASSSLSSSSSSSSSSSAPSPARKRAKFDEDEIDWLIGDLRKEEAQLVILTRLTEG